MWAILRTCGQVCATPTAAVIPSADWMLVMRKQYFGWGTALSKRKSVQPSVKIVSTWSSSATGPSAGVLALEMMPVNRSILPSSFIRRNSLTLASVPAASSAVMVSIWRLPRNPPWALISSAAIVWPFSDGSPSTAAALVRKVIWPTLNGVSGILPLAGSPAALTIRVPPTRPAAANPAPPTATPRLLRKPRRLAMGVFSMNVPPFNCLVAATTSGRDGTTSCVEMRGAVVAAGRAGHGIESGREYGAVHRAGAGHREDHLRHGDRADLCADGRGIRANRGLYSRGVQR